MYKRLRRRGVFLRPAKSPGCVYALEDETIRTCLRSFGCNYEARFARAAFCQIQCLPCDLRRLKPSFFRRAACTYTVSRSGGHFFLEFPGSIQAHR